MYRLHPDHAVVADERLQEVFVLKDGNCTDSEQLNNESLSMDSGVCGLLIDSTGGL